jgi:hypothetical protein
MKNCTICNEFKDLKKFPPCKNTKDGRNNQCRKCIKNNKRRLKPEEHKTKRRKMKLQHNYKLTPEQYDKMFTDQNGVCALCSKPESAVSNNGRIKNLCVDHCHKTNKIRGLLCNWCNRGLGLFRDDALILRLAADYIELNK